MITELREIAFYVNEKIRVDSINHKDYISTANMYPDKGGVDIADELPKATSVTKYQNDDILVSNIRPYFKKIWYSNRIGGCSNDVIVFRVNNTEQINPKYLYYVLSQDAFFDFMMSGSNGTKMPRGNKKLIPEFKFKVHSIDKQKHIADILSAYDDLIKNNKNQINLLEEAAKGLYKEWFVNLHFPGYEDTTIVDGVPEGWEKVYIEDVCQTVGGGTPSTKVTSYYANGKIPWVTPTDITTNDCLVLLDTKKRITEEGLAKSSAKMLPPETILMTSRASVGFFGISEQEVCTNQGFISCIPHYKNMMMYLLLNLMNRKDEIRLKAGGSTYLEISKATFRKFTIVKPRDSILVEFQDKTYPMLKSIRTLRKQNLLLEQARNKLLPKLISGELEV